MARRTALPSSDEPCAQQLASLRRSHTRHNQWVVVEEVIEFKDSLGKEAKGKETAVDCQWSSVDDRIAVVTHDNNTCWNWEGPRVWIVVKPYDCGVRDPIQKPKARKVIVHMLSWNNTRKISTVHGQTLYQVGRPL